MHSTVVKFCIIGFKCDVVLFILYTKFCSRYLKCLLKPKKQLRIFSSILLVVFHD